MAHDVLLWAGVGLELFCVAGVLAVRGALNRLHFTAPAGLGVVLVMVALLLDDGFSPTSDTALLVAFTVLVGSPVLTHLLARATWVRDGDGDGRELGR